MDWRRFGRGARSLRFLLALGIAWFAATATTAAIAAATVSAANATAAAPPAALFSAQERAWIAAHPVVRIAVDPYLRPLEYLQNGKYLGLTADYIAAVSAISGLRFEVAPFAADQIAEGLAKQEIDLLPAVSPTFTPSAIRDQLIVSAPYFVGNTIIVTRVYGAIVFDLRALDGKTVALKGGGVYEDFLRRNYPQIHLRIVDTPDQALSAVASSDADAAVGVDAVLLPLLYGKYRDTLGVSGALADTPAVIAFGTRAQLPELASILKKSLRSLTARQTDDFVKRWLTGNNYRPPSWADILRHRWPEAALIAAALLALLLALLLARRARRTAEKNERDKARFLAVMSHEIRTPMNAILSSVELLARSKLTQQQRQFADLASTASEALLELLDDVLDLSKLEARRLTLVKTRTDMQQLAHGVVDIAELQARSKNLTIQLEIDLPAATDLLLDPARIRQILINLTSNAVKFTERGCIRVRVELERDAEMKTTVSTTAPATLLMTVSDTGIGVPPERQKDLFRAYHQAHQTSTRRFGGTGLGLAICRELCELMDGDIRFDSKPGSGSVVVCRIPVELLPMANDAADKNDHSDPAVSGTALAAAGQAPHILVVEDHPGNRMVLRQQLTQLGYRFTIVEDGLSALGQTMHTHFALMLLDCYLPDIDGYTVASRQRAREGGHSHLPIIAISAAVDQEHLDACMRSGMDGTLRKPLRLTALETLLDGWCGPGRPRQNGQASEDADRLDFSPAPAPAADTDLAAIFIATARDDLTDLEDAVRRQALDHAARVAHRMHGAALVCKWPHVAALAQTIEHNLKEPPDLLKVSEALSRLRAALENDAGQGDSD